MIERHIIIIIQQQRDPPQQHNIEHVWIIESVNMYVRNWFYFLCSARSRESSYRITIFYIYIYSICSQYNHFSKLYFACQDSKDCRYVCYVMTVPRILPSCLLSNRSPIVNIGETPTPTARQMKRWRGNSHKWHAQRGASSA